MAEARRRISDLARIEIALNRIAESEHDRCVECGEALACPRLEIDPAGHLCIACAR